MHLRDYPQSHNLAFACLTLNSLFCLRHFGDTAIQAMQCSECCFLVLKITCLWCSLPFPLTKCPFSKCQDSVAIAVSLAAHDVCMVCPDLPFHLCEHLVCGDEEATFILVATIFIAILLHIPTAVLLPWSQLMFRVAEGQML